MVSILDDWLIDAPMEAGIPVSGNRFSSPLSLEYRVVVGSEFDTVRVSLGNDQCTIRCG